MTQPYRVASKLVVLEAVVRGGSLTAAAEELGIGKATVSQHLRELEAMLQTPLVERSSRRLRTTVAGERLYARAGQIVQAVRAGLDDIERQREQVEGELRVAAPRVFGSAFLPGVIASFTERFPAATVTVLLDDHLVDLDAQRIDVAIQAGQPSRGDHVATVLRESPHRVVAAPAMADRHRGLRHPTQLAALPAVVFSVLESGQVWDFAGPGGERVDVELQADVQVDDVALMREMALRHGRIAVIPELMIERELAEGELQVLLPDWRLPAVSVMLVHAPRRRLAHRARAFVDHLRAECGH